MNSAPLTVSIGKQKLDGDLLVLGTLRRHLKGNDHALKMLNEVIDDLSAASKVVLKQEQAKAAREHRWRERIERVNPPRGKKLITWWSKGEKVVVERYGGYTLGTVAGVGRLDHKHMLRVKLNSGKTLNLDHGTVHHLSPEYWIKVMMGPRPVEPKRSEPVVRWGGKWKAETNSREEIATRMKNEFQIIYEIVDISTWRPSMKFEGYVQVDGEPGAHNRMNVIIWHDEMKRNGWIEGKVAYPVTIKNNHKNEWRVDDVLSPELLESEEVA